MRTNSCRPVGGRYFPMSNLLSTRRPFNKVCAPHGPSTADLSAGHKTQCLCTLPIVCGDLTILSQRPAGPSPRSPCDSSNGSIWKFVFDVPVTSYANSQTAWCMRSFVCSACQCQSKLPTTPTDDITTTPAGLSIGHPAISWIC